MARTVAVEQRGDIPQLIAVLGNVWAAPRGGRPRTRADLVLADKA